VHEPREAVHEGRAPVRKPKTRRELKLAKQNGVIIQVLCRMAKIEGDPEIEAGKLLLTRFEFASLIKRLRKIVHLIYDKKYPEGAAQLLDRGIDRMIAVPSKAEQMMDETLKDMQSVSTKLQ